MSRMLEALRQIEARQPRPQATFRPIESRASSRPVELHPTILEELDALQSSIMSFNEPVPTLSTLDTGISEGINVDESLEQAESAVVSALSLAEPDIYEDMAQYILAKTEPGQSAALLFTSPGECAEKSETLRLISKSLAEHFQIKTVVIDTSLNDNKPVNKKMPRVSGGWWHLFEEYKQRHQLVLIDAPSLADAQAAAMISQCDGVYLVIRLGYSTAYDVREAVRVIDQAGGLFLGSIAVNA
jgi:hypothetical protein